MVGNAFSLMMRRGSHQGCDARRRQQFQDLTEGGRGSPKEAQATSG